MESLLLNIENKTEKKILVCWQFWVKILHCTVYMFARPAIKMLLPWTRDDQAIFYTTNTGFLISNINNTSST